MGEAESKTGGDHQGTAGQQHGALRGAAGIEADTQGQDGRSEQRRRGDDTDLEGGVTQPEQIGRQQEQIEGDSEERREYERRGSKELQRARRELKAALLDKWDSPREEQQRIAEILKRAAAQILGR